jgi:glycerol-3-phosphate dehydrogenase (NAD(P)+)
MKATVLGGGSWGTALALQLARAGNSVLLWDHRAERALKMQEARENTQYLPGIRFPSNLRVTGDLAEALAGSQFVVEAIPSQKLRQVMVQALPYLNAETPLCCASKGIEEGSLMTMEELLRDVLPIAFHAQLSFLAGPSFAKEVAENMPTAVVIAARFSDVADASAGAFHAGNFRAYFIDDIIGAELGGALKNIIAIACGVADGMGIGNNARAALMTRGLAEITRLAVIKGAHPSTLAGLAGMGDLVLTCTGGLSRNRRVGIGLGQGLSLEEVLESLGQVAEGVTTTRSAMGLARQYEVEMPITEQIHALLFESRSAEEVLHNLLGRERKSERS